MGGRRLHSILEIADCLHLTLRPLAAVPVARSSGDGIIGVWAVSGKGKADFLLKLSFPVYDEYFFKQAALDVGSGTQLGLFLGWACGMARLIAGFPTNAGVVEIFGGDNKGILHHYRCTPGGKAAPIHRVRGSDRRGGDLHCLLSCLSLPWPCAHTSPHCRRSTLPPPPDLFPQTLDVGGNLHMSIRSLTVSICGGHVAAACDNNLVLFLTRD